jgi:hypothetical protein
MTVRIGRLPADWSEYFIPLDRDDPRNRLMDDPEGDRIRVRFRRVGSEIVDFVAPFEAAVDGQGHAVVLRSDGSHAPHYDRYDRFGRKRTSWLDPNLSTKDTIKLAITDIKANWRSTRRTYVGES